MEEDLRECVNHGVNYIKVASEQALIWANEVRRLVTADKNVMFPEDIQKPALAAVKSPCGAISASSTPAIRSKPFVCVGRA